MSSRKLYSAIIVIFCLLVAAQFSACSPTYIARAGWEEAKILWKKEPISELLADDSIPQELKDSLSLVLEVREFTKQQGLIPGGSYSEYSDIGREVLVWVLSASEKKSLTPLTWWFPIVGRVPYKGFFEKDQGLKEARNLKGKGYDIYLRPSPAFSTLGWLNDPFLSTMNSKDHLAITNVIIHEILHNTIWIKGSASFNETMANFVGAAGTIAFFEERNTNDSPLAKEARRRLIDELIYAEHIENSIKTIDQFYLLAADSSSFEEDREQLFNSILKQWQKKKSLLKSEAFLTSGSKINNAVILAQRVYYDRFALFQQMYKNCGNDFAKFISSMKSLASEANKSKTDIWDIFQLKLKQTC